MFGYYDLVLGLIPLTMLVFTGLLHGVGLTVTTAVPLAAVVAAGLIGHAMFVNAPVDQLGVDAGDEEPTHAPGPAAD